jgi:hypothetical protein
MRPISGKKVKVIGMKSVTVIAEDRVALLSDISYILGKSNVNIESLNVEIVGGKAVISLMVKDPKRAKDILVSNGYNTAELDAIVIKVSNQLGELTRITDRLSKERVSVENVSEISSTPSEGVFALRVDKPRKALRILGDNVLINGNSGYA